jgi:hypothetical protein
MHHHDDRACLTLTQREKKREKEQEAVDTVRPYSVCKMSDGARSGIVSTAVSPHHRERERERRI